MTETTKVNLLGLTQPQLEGSQVADRGLHRPGVDKTPAKVEPRL